MKQKILFSLYSLIPVFLYSFILVPSAAAYTTNMNAYVVIGQNDFTSGSINMGGGAGGISAAGLNQPYALSSDGQHLFVSEESNHRLLIWNTIPTTNGKAADVVVGQANFQGGSSNQGGSVNANTLFNPGSPVVAQGKFIVPDQENNRVLIYNKIPTTNNASADIVIGQTDMTSNSTGTSSTKLKDSYGVTYDEATGKLLVLDYSNRRILIYNNIPTANGVAADVVVGQTNFTSSSTGTTASTFSSSIYTARVFQGKLFVADTSNNRVLIFNSIPTTNGASADVVIGQQNFTSGSAYIRT